ncbi:MAG: ABC transporter permease [Anaerolineae bacterium]|nr:ABC transporter permease [Anaerolineae bacterium]
MGKYIIRRLLMVIPTLWGVFTILFILAFMMPGDPLRAVLGEEYNRLDPEVIEATRERMGLNDPFHVRYLKFLEQMLRFDLGESQVHEESVSAIIGYRFPRTAQLMIGAMVVAVLIGLPAGIVAAERQYSWVDHWLMVVALIGVSMPVFWSALLAQLVLTQEPLAVFPVAGYEEGSVRHMMLPSLVLGAYYSATLARVTRSSMLEVKTQPYVTTARAKGLRYRVILTRHQLRNALIPVITVIALDIGGLLGGAIVTETVFNWPGLGRAIVPAIMRRDTPVILGILIFGAFLYIAINLITDLAYVLINPRIRYE